MNEPGRQPNNSAEPVCGSRSGSMGLIVLAGIVALSGWMAFLLWREEAPAQPAPQDQSHQITALTAQIESHAERQAATQARLDSLERRIENLNLALESVKGQHPPATESSAGAISPEQHAELLLWLQSSFATERQKQRLRFAQSNKQLLESMGIQRTPEADTRYRFTEIYSVIDDDGGPQRLAALYDIISASMGPQRQALKRIHDLEANQGSAAEKSVAEAALIAEQMGFYKSVAAHLKPNEVKRLEAWLETLVHHPVKLTGG